MPAIRIILVSILLLFMAAPACAATPLTLYSGQQEISLYENFRYLPETGSPYTISDVQRRKSDFIPYPDDNPNFGFQEEALWLYVPLKNVSGIDDWVLTVGFSQLDNVDFYVVAGNKVTQSHQGKAQKEQLFRIPTMRIQLPESTPVDVFVRVKSNSSSLIVPLTLQPESMHSAYVQWDSILWGLFYGGLVILAIYNLVLYLNVREPSLVAYVGYILAVILWQFIWGGHVHLLVDDGLPLWFVGHTELIFIIIGLSSGIFTMTFLDTRVHARHAHPIVVGMLVAQIGVALICLTGLLPPVWKNNLVYGVGMLAICSYIYAGFEAYANRFQPARYFIFAWTMLAGGAIIGMLSLVGVLPSNAFTAYCFQVGVFLEAGLFSLALMEKSRSQLQSEVEQATNDLRNNMELIEEQNARLDIARKDAIKASNVKSQFLANMSHEIRTPLNAILGFSRELTLSALPTDQQEQVRIISTAADNLLSIVNDVLDFSKIEAGKLQINNQPFSPNQLLEEMVTIMSKTAHGKRLEFVFELQPLPEKLIGDIYRIKQVLNNLLSNALKFTSSGTITLAVSGRALPHGIHELNIKVKDTGIGISRQDQKKLFNAFSQVDDALNRSYQGTGLGLVICRELVRLMRGNLTLKSTPNVGSTFEVTLRTNQLSQKYSLGPHPDWIGKQVVIFDPVPATRMASARLMQHLGASTTSVESLAYLRTLDMNADYLMAVTPVTKTDKRDEYLSELVQFSAKKRILWYSGGEPFNQYPSLTQYFHSQLRMPMSLSKLDDLVNHKMKPQRNPMQDKIDALPRARILAVDDMDMNLKLLDTWLSDSPITLTTSMSGQDAVNCCQTHEYDLILMDVQMPGMDGLQASRAIRQTALNLGTPIIAVTAHAFKEEQEKLLASGMDDYLPKPIELGTLLDLIRRWCQPVSAPAMALPTLDWQLALKRANQNANAAEELLRDFTNLLPASVDVIKHAWDDRNYTSLKAEVHRLHGACCYTGLPKLQHLTSELETALKLGQHFLVAEQLPGFMVEAESVLVAASDHLESITTSFG
ncbi:ATP-binding protein [Alteromonas sp. ASW11-19]|uniref:histidine kinase n=2 Tax=Alteromonas salexigens TaxID=2982530 RepID=A0ABT2VLN0_9ALTE|nr:hybrid sensor histidine kinase/response regulator [Alteromonas salexigens]MCU7553333.1 ATP-binding protein [Alteromonas salexigens]